MRSCQDFGYRIWQLALTDSSAVGLGHRVVLRMFTLFKRENSDRLGKLLVSCRGRSGSMFGLLLADASAVAFDLL